MWILIIILSVDLAGTPRTSGTPGALEPINGDVVIMVPDPDPPVLVAPAAPTGLTIEVE